MADNETNQAMLRQFIEQIWNAGDIEACGKFIAPVYTIHHDPGDPWEKQTLDLARYRERVRLSRAPFPDQQFTIQELLCKGDIAIMTWLWCATHLGDIPGFPATGKPITMSGATVYYIADARLTGHWQITDRLGVYTQLRQAAAQQ